VKSRRGLAAIAVAAVVGAAVVPHPASAVAAVPDTGVTFTLRYSGQGWGDVTQTGAASLTCRTPWIGSGGPPSGPAAQSLATPWIGSGRPPSGPAAQSLAACQDGSDPTRPTTWVDVDQDLSTVNSSRAVLAIPPKASVDWVGLYWAGDRGSRADDGQPRCDAAPANASPPTLPPAPDKANQVKLSVGDKAYQVVTANSLTAVTGPGGGTGFQAYVDITSLVRPVAGTPQLAISVADLQAAAGPGCGGGWTAVLAYSYADGPDKTSAPDFRSIAIFDGTLTTRAGVEQEVRLPGVPTPAPTGPPPRLTSSLFASGQGLGQHALTLGSALVPRTGDGVTEITGQPGAGYHRATSPIPPNAIAPDPTLGVTTARNTFVTAVLGLSTPLAVKVNLSVATAMDPTTAPVGAEATLTVTVRNDADVNAYGVQVTVRLPAGLTLVGQPPNYFPGTGVWRTGAVAAHGSSGLSLRVLVKATGDLVSSAQITATDLPNENPPGNTGKVTFVAVPGAGPSPSPSRPAQASVVTAEAWRWPQVAPAALFGTGLFLLGLLLLSVAVIRHRARVG
jgi:uncharacterized repeat protein (TIGR01451 family)